MGARLCLLLHRDDDNFHYLCILPLSTRDDGWQDERISKDFFLDSGIVMHHLPSLLLIFEDGRQRQEGCASATAISTAKVKGEPNFSCRQTFIINTFCHISQPLLCLLSCSRKVMDLEQRLEAGRRRPSSSISSLESNVQISLDSLIWVISSSDICHVPPLDRKDGTRVLEVLLMHGETFLAAVSRAWGRVAGNGVRDSGLRSTREPDSLLHVSVPAVEFCSLF